MPVVVRTRPYDQTFYEEIGETDWTQQSDEKVLKAAALAKDDLGF
jgi:hypothetical protein